MTYVFFFVRKLPPFFSFFAFQRGIFISVGGTTQLKNQQNRKKANKQTTGHNGTKNIVKNMNDAVFWIIIILLAATTILFFYWIYVLCRTKHQKTTSKIVAKPSL